MIERTLRVGIALAAVVASLAGVIAGRAHGNVANVDCDEKTFTRMT